MVKFIRTKEGEQPPETRIVVNMVMGERSVQIVDNKWKSLTGMIRAMDADVDDVISESTYEQIFADVVEALHESGIMSEDEAAACVTFPAGTTHHFVETTQA